MDKVILLKRHLKDFVIIDKSVTWVNGEAILQEIEEITFKGIPMPIDQRTLSLLPQGALSNDSIRIYTKQDLGQLENKYIKRLSDNKVYRVYNAKAFQELADVKIYLLDKWEGES